MNASRRQLAMLRSLRTRKGREEAGLFLVEGVRLCEELLHSRAAHPPPGVSFPAGAAAPRVELVLIAHEQDKDGGLSELAARFAAGAGAEIIAAPMRDFERVSDTVQSQGILAAARWNDFPSDALRFGGQATVLALDAVSDPGNVGTAIRTAAWFGVSAVILGEGCADLFNPKTVRATMGGIFQVPVCRNENLTDALARIQALGFRVTAATMDGQTDWRGWAMSPRSALVLGSEARGVSEEVCRLADQRVTIPRRGAGESLNVAVSAGILLSTLQ